MKYLKIATHYTTAFLLSTVLLVSSCDLTEEIPDKLTAENVAADPTLLDNLIAPSLSDLRQLCHRESVWGMQEATSDEMFFPTRGADWFDGGVWQADYRHEWTPQHRDVVQIWSHLNAGISHSNFALLALGEESADDPHSILAGRAQILFLRSYYEYNLYDLYRTYPKRSPFDLDFFSTPQILRGEEGFYKIVSTVKATLPYIVSRENARYGEPNRDAALMLLAKMYINKEVYIGIAGYDSSLIYLNELNSSGHYALANDYFDLFSVENGARYNTADDEGIFVAIMDDAENFGLDGRVVWAIPTFHYKQTLGGATNGNWNGCSAPEGYLMTNWIAGTDTATDVRWKDGRFYENMAVNLGFNYGQQYEPKTGDSLTDRNGNYLNFTFVCPLVDANEYQGVRVLKYPPRVKPVQATRTPNDFLIWRFADALLMQAECLVRAENNISGAVDIVNQIRAKRNAPDITAGTTEEILDKLLVERGLELYWEGHRRQDMIRFGTFLQPKIDKPDVSPSTAIIIPIPQTAIDGTPDGVLTQNPGY